jgi:hypothetical protein
MSHPPNKLEEYENGYISDSWSSVLRSIGYHNNIISVHYGRPVYSDAYTIRVYSSNTNLLDIIGLGYDDWYSQVLATLYVYASDPLV